MLSNAFALAILSTGCLYFLYTRLPASAKKWLIDHSLFTDITVMIITFWILGGSVTALFASAVVDLLISMMLHIAKHPTDYQWIFDCLNTVKDLVAKLKDYLLQFNTQYKAAKQAV